MTGEVRVAVRALSARGKLVENVSEVVAKIMVVPLFGVGLEFLVMSTNNFTLFRKSVVAQ